MRINTKLNLFHAFLALLYLLPATGLGLAVYKSWANYSFWSDELGSVSMSLLVWSDVWAAILTDVHPPMFQLVLKAWVSLIGSDESLVRLFSLGCALISLAVLALNTRAMKGLAQWSAITIFTTSFLFPFYAQEARSYSLTLLLSTLVTVNLLKYHRQQNESRKGIWALFFYSIALSVTHYFGLLLSLCALSILAFEHRRDKKLICMCLATILTCLAWPMRHYASGLFELKGAKNAWMVVNGPIDSARIFTRTFFPASSDTLLVIYGSIFLMILAYGLLAQYRYQSPYNNQTPTIYRATSLLVSMIVVISVADVISPISTERNFIVLLPTLSILTGLLVYSWLQRQEPLITSGVLIILIISTGLNNLHFAATLMSLKWGPQQNWRESAQFVVKNRTTERLYYLRNRDDEETDRVFNFYIQKLSDNTLSLERIYIGQIPEISRPAFLVLGGTSPSVVKEVMQLSKSPKALFFQPKQSLSSTTGVIIFK
jgi:uncharacterized membrane protein